MEDYKRAIRAAKWAGAKAVTVHCGGSILVIPLDGDYLAGLAQGQPPASVIEERKEVKLNW